MREAQVSYEFFLPLATNTSPQRAAAQAWNTAYAFFHSDGFELAVTISSQGSRIDAVATGFVPVAES